MQAQHWRASSVIRLLHTSARVEVFTALPTNTAGFQLRLHLASARRGGWLVLKIYKNHMRLNFRSISAKANNWAHSVSLDANFEPKHFSSKAENLKLSGERGMKLIWSFMELVAMRLAKALESVVTPRHAVIHINVHSSEKITRGLAHPAPWERRQKAWNCPRSTNKMQRALPRMELGWCRERERKKMDIHFLYKNQPTKP